MSLEYVRLAASVATPIVVAFLGVVLLRRVESIKAIVAKQSDFHRKWADGFFSCCQDFLLTVEQELALLTSIAGSRSDNGAITSDIVEELNKSHRKLSELELRIRLSIVFAPKFGERSAQAAAKCIQLLHHLLASGGGSVDELIATMDDFNRASRDSHAEMLGLAPEQNQAHLMRGRSSLRAVERDVAADGAAHASPSGRVSSRPPRS